MADPLIDDLFAALGLAPEGIRLARATLEAAGLTRPGKVRIAEGKVGRVRAEIERRFGLCCTTPACRESTVGDPRPVLTVTREACPICGGSSNALAIQQMAAVMARHKITRLLVLGGTPGLQRELGNLLPPTIESRFVLAEDRRNSREAGEEQRWADIVVIWASTPIPHKTTQLYEGDKVVRVARRGLTALAQGVMDWLADR